MPACATLERSNIDTPTAPHLTMTSTAAPRPAKAGRPGTTPTAKPLKAAETVAAELRRQIVTGRLKPGDKLHPENVLQAEFDVSRPTLREALRLLESESLITISRGKHGGARVGTVDLASAARQVGVFLQIERVTLADVWLARTIIEPPAAALLAQSRNEAAFAELEANIAAARDAVVVTETVRELIQDAARAGVPHLRHHSPPA